MTDKQQIEEMLNDMTNILLDECEQEVERNRYNGRTRINMRVLAQALFIQNYRKVPKNAVVLTQEELEEMVKAKMKCINDMAIITRKETTKEFWDKLQEIAVTSFLNSEGDICYLEEEYVSLRDIEKVLKQLSVEVEK